MSQSSGFHPFGGRLSRRWNRDSLSPDDAYLSYHDIRLTREDVETLKDDWLTDNIIAFWQEYLEREYLGSMRNINIVLLRPSMSFMLTHTPDPLTLKGALPDFSKASHIFLPINDCGDVETPEGGSHWSLLLVSIIDGVAFHYDSLNPSNRSSARIVAEKISKLVKSQMQNQPLKFLDLEDTPQQENSTDCGVYVCMQMRVLLLDRLLKTNKEEKITMAISEKELPKTNDGRREMLKIIEGFRKEGERRRSPSANSRRSQASGGPPRIE
ncbi:cysteine proteinase [Xylona heveae TC161]|uniref:Cysteine proteinase n=1 Tax=Xylona heveae (strain CBS 132557 / TC161) TaxID=1328760 RepID=A0A165JZ07_XYLHT|nr:cysteine proteinase [Xylona heveae TC161]KZF26807.1 cysteine proteinase [Xylona heveae TC161]